MRWTRCSVNFNMLLGTYYREPLHGRDARMALMDVFKKCIPSPTSIFSGPVTMHHLLHANDYVLDKTFVYGAIMLSKWLGQERLLAGVFGFWPPEPPPGAIPAPDAAEEAGHEPLCDE